MGVSPKSKKLLLWFLFFFFVKKKRSWLEPAHLVAHRGPNGGKLTEVVEAKTNGGGTGV